MMLVEAAAAVLLGIGLLWMVFQPFLTPPAAEPEFVEPLELEETARGQALLALKEIEFDRETGKLSDADYAMLKSRYSALAIEAIREEERQAPAPPADLEALIAARVERLKAEGGLATPGAVAACPVCGPRPEAGALWCSGCGQPLPGLARCGDCRAPVDAAARYCTSCGAGVPPASEPQVA
jgi:formate dehydrogenase maturation protein FdhE